MKVRNLAYISVLILGFCLIFLIFESCNTKNTAKTPKGGITAKDILGDPNYLAISYGGYRENTRDVQPTISQLKEDMRILSAMGIKLLRTYNVHLAQAENLLKAIKELKSEEEGFEIYVMLGTWIDCENAWTSEPNHSGESPRNEVEINRAVELTQQYPEIIKMIAVGNEAMVKWAAGYYVQAGVILKWVKHLQTLKKEGSLPKNLWITSSDNFASWGGGSADYHVDELVQLIHEVDFISMHTYPMHDTHYNPSFWNLNDSLSYLSIPDKVAIGMNGALSHAQSQYNSVKNYLKQLGVTKPVHIGETGWASSSNEKFGPGGSNACDEFKQGLFYKSIRTWTNSEGITCFFFEAFDENWKDQDNEGGSENHFGLFTLDGRAKYAIWDLVDKGLFKELSRDGIEIRKTYNGDEARVIQAVLPPPINKSKN